MALDLASMLMLTLVAIGLSLLPLPFISVSALTLDLIHRDSPNSPFYNASETPFQRLSNSLTLSVNRANGFYYTNSDQPVSPIFRDGSVYLMKLYIGTPPVALHADLDTGSDPIWTQCKGCRNCFPETAPLFDPKASSTYKLLPCETQICKSQGQSCSAGEPPRCNFSIHYLDGTFSNGEYGYDTISLESSMDGKLVSFPNTVFGCAYDSSISPVRNDKFSGVVGLGRGMVSLSSQLSYMTGMKFSYCLSAKPEINSKLIFGDIANSGSGVVTTPLVTKDDNENGYINKYYSILQAIYVGPNLIPYNTNVSLDGPLVMIDSGTTFSYVPSDIYASLEGAVIKEVGFTRVEPPLDFAKLCFRSEADNFDFSLTLQFIGADLHLSEENAFFRANSGTVCFTFLPIQDVRFPSILGNTAQINHLIGFDVDNKILSFKKMRCGVDH